MSCHDCKETNSSVRRAASVVVIRHSQSIIPSLFSSVLLPIVRPVPVFLLSSIRTQAANNSANNHVTLRVSFVANLTCDQASYDCSGDSDAYAASGLVKGVVELVLEAFAFATPAAVVVTTLVAIKVIAVASASRT